MKNVVRLFVTMLVLLGFSGAVMAGEVPSVKNQTVKGPVPMQPNIPKPDLKCVAYALWNNGSKDIKINNGDQLDTTWGYYPGITIKYYVSAENYGTIAKAKNFVLKTTITRDGAVIKQASQTIGNLEPGKGVKFEIPPIQTGTDGQNHHYKLFSTVDATNVIAETNENNNTYTLEFNARVQLLH